VHFEDSWFADVRDPIEWKQALDRIRLNRSTVRVEDIFGSPIESTDKLVSYWNWMLKVFRDHPEAEFINATEGGILREPFKVTSLREAIHRFCRRDLGISSLIRSTLAEAKENNLLYVGANLSVLSGELAAITHVLDTGAQLCEGIHDYAPQELMKRLETTKQAIYCNPHLSPLLDCFNQMGNFVFLRKRNGIAKQARDPNLGQILKHIYSEYFLSVRKALETIGNALSQIETNLNLTSGQPSQKPADPA
jgi:hypothetical protein